MIDPGASVVITLRWPPPILFPNARNAAHWRKVAGPKQEYRDACFWLTKEAMGRKRFLQQPQVQIAFFPPDRRRRDRDGCIGAIKALQDGMAQAIGFDDSEWQPIYTFHPPAPPDGRVVVVLTAKGANHE